MRDFKQILHHAMSSTKGIFKKGVGRADNNFLKKFGLTSMLLSVAGADKKLANNESQVVNKYASIGALLLFPPALGLFSYSYAIFTYLNSSGLTGNHKLLASVAIGTILASFVFWIDRTIVVTHRKHDKSKSYVVIRLGLAIVIARMLTAPIEALVFNGVIQEKRNETAVKAVEDFERKAAHNPRLIEAIRVRDRVMSSINERQKRLDTLEGQRLCECNGTCGTGRYGIGPECSRLTELLNNVERPAVVQFKAENTPVLEQANNTIAALSNRTSNMGAVMQSSKLKQDFMSDMTILLSLSEEKTERGSAIAYMHWIVFLFFLGLELSPVLLKFFMPKDNYDERLQTLEQNTKVTEENEREQWQLIQVHLHASILEMRKMEIWFEQLSGVSKVMISGTEKQFESMKEMEEKVSEMIKNAPRFQNQAKVEQLALDMLSRYYQVLDEHHQRFNLHVKV